MEARGDLRADWRLLGTLMLSESESCGDCSGSSGVGGIGLAELEWCGRSAHRSSGEEWYECGHCSQFAVSVSRAINYDVPLRHHLLVRGRCESDCGLRLGI